MPVGNDNDPLQVLAIGRLTYYKGFEYLIRAAARVRDVRVDIVGTGDMEKHLRSVLSGLRLENRVRLRGAVTNRELGELLDRCDCMCLPSIERTEAFGMVLLEAMLHGKATVVSDVPGSGMGWIVEHGGTGIKVKPADVEALAGALTRLRENREETREMGRRGKEKFDRAFEIDHSVALLIDVYREVTASEPGHGKANI